MTLTWFSAQSWYPAWYRHTWAGHLRAVALLWQTDPVELIAAHKKPPLWSVSVLLQIIVMDYWFQTAQYCSSTPRLPPWRTLNPIIPQPKVDSSPARGLIDVMWTPSFVLIKKLLCWFVLYCVLLFFCKDVSTNVKVSGPLYQYGFFHHATILCVPTQATTAVCNTVCFITSQIILQYIL